MAYGGCENCPNEAYGDFYQGCFYCDTCLEYYHLEALRCFSVAAIYGESGLIAVAYSIDKCAERNAIEMALAKRESEGAECLLNDCVLVVGRVRHNKNNKRSFGLSKPCVQCIYGMQANGIRAVCYSDPGAWTHGGANMPPAPFVWTKVKEVTTSYASKCKEVCVPRRPSLGQISERTITGADGREHRVVLIPHEPPRRPLSPAATAHRLCGAAALLESLPSWPRLDDAARKLVRSD
jgi:hypothetical protein